MNIILFLNEPLRQAISLYLTDILKLPTPVNCMHISHLNELYNELRPVIIITEVAFINDHLLGSELANSIKADVQCRKIVLLGNAIVSIENNNLSINDKETIGKLQKAVEFYMKYPNRLIYSICLVGVTYAQYVNKPYSPVDVSKTPMAAIKKLKSSDNIKWGHSYVVIDKKKNQMFRTIHPSTKNGFYILKIDKQLTPNEYRRKQVTQEIPRTDILGILSITAEIRSF